MHDTKERLSLLWLFALLNYLYADVVGLWAMAGSRHFVSLPPGALMGSAVLMEIPIAMILLCRLLPFRANRLANIIHWNELDKGGHFAAWEQPEIFVGEIRDCFRKVR